MTQRIHLDETDNIMMEFGVRGSPQFFSHNNFLCYLYINKCSEFYKVKVFEINEMMGS